MPRTRKKTDSFELKKDNSKRNATELKLYFTQITGKKPINPKTKKITGDYKNFKSDYKKFENEAIKKINVIEPSESIKIPNIPKSRTEIEIKEPSKPKAKPKAKTTAKTTRKTKPLKIKDIDPNEYPFKLHSMKSYMKAPLTNLETKSIKTINDKKTTKKIMKKPNITKDATIKMNELVYNYLIELRNNYITFMKANLSEGKKSSKSRKRIYREDIEYARKLLPFSEFKPISVLPKKLPNKFKIKKACLGVVYKNIKDLATSEADDITQLNPEALPSLCHATLSYIQGMTVLAEKIMILLNKKTIDASLIDLVVTLMKEIKS